MKTIFKNIAIIVLISSIFLSLSSYAQTPQKMSYQAVLRNAGNTLISNTPVAMRVSVLQGSATGTAVYVERHTLTTNINGLATFEIGAGTIISGSFATINWGSGQYFVKTETDPAGGTNYNISGTSQLLSVPYALYAKTVDGISATNTTNWNTAFAWGNHSGLYRPNTYVPNWSEITNKPLLDGSETKVTAGTNVSITGAGTTASPYVVNSTGTGTRSPQWTTTGDNISNTNTGNVGIGVTDPEYKLDLGGRMRIRATPGNRAGIFLNNEANTSLSAFVGMQSDDRVGFFGSGIGNSFMVVNTISGNVGIGTFNSAAKLEVNGFTKLGSDAPAIKFKKLTGTTAANEGESNVISHGLPYEKILSVSVLVNTNAPYLIPPSYRESTGYEYNYYIDQFHIWILNKTLNSANILSKPVKILITYEE